MAFRKLKEKGLVQFLGLTGTGEAAALRAVVRSGRFDTLQVPFNILNQSAGVAAPPEEGEADYGNIIADCGQMGLGVYAIRVFAGGAILGQAPSAHTLRTPFFPLALFERDLRRAEVLHRSRGGSMSPAELSVRFVLSHPHVSSALIGFGCPAHVDEIARLLIDPTSPSYPEDRI
jgi:aryl-alcohol dehydrogenase-like predicted oxidoreductase